MHQTLSPTPAWTILQLRLVITGWCRRGQRCVLEYHSRTSEHAPHSHRNSRTPILHRMTQLIWHIWPGSGSCRKLITICGKFATVSCRIRQTGQQNLEKFMRKTAIHKYYPVNTAYLVGLRGRSKLITICGKFAAVSRTIRQSGPQNLEKFAVENCDP